MKWESVLLLKLLVVAGQVQSRDRGKDRGWHVPCPVQWKDSLSRGSSGKHGRAERKPYSSNPPSCSKGDYKQEGEWGAEAGGRQVLGTSRMGQSSGLRQSLRWKQEITLVQAKAYGVFD